jgi:hypothetical protein
MKYLVAVAGPQAVKPVRALLGASSWTREIRRGRWTVLVHTDGASGYLRDDLSLFKGWYVDHCAERLVFAPDGGRPSPADPFEGCYVTMRASGEALMIGNDLFCQLPLLHVCEPELFVASDSLFAISRIRQAVGLACAFDRQVARARAWTRSLGLQNQSDRTILAGVGFCGVGASLRVGLAGGALSCETERTPAREIFRSSGESYAAAVRRAAVRLGRHLASLAAAGSAVSCSLSGGQDSRAVLAAASLVEKAAAKVRVVSYRYAAADFAIASRLAAMAGLGLHQLRPSRNVTEGASPVAGWLVHSAGLYDRLELAPDLDPADGVFTVGGHGGELLKGMWNWRRLGWLVCGAPLGCQGAVRAECSRGLAAMGVSPWERGSAEWHYLGYRNAIHGGRRSANYMLNGSPLMQRDLVGLVHSDRPDRRGISVVSDMTLVLRPDMAGVPYARQARAPSRAYLRDRLRELGGPVDAGMLEPYEIVGEPRDARLRSSPVFLDLAARLAPEATDATDLAVAALERCPSELSAIYRPMAKRLLAARERGGPLGQREGFLKAKLLALHLVD